MNKVNEECMTELVQLHVDYINAGAEIITTNTYKTNPNSDKENSQKLVQNAVKACKLAVE